MIKVAHKWSFPSVQAYAARVLFKYHLPNVSPADKLCTVALYGVKDLEWTAYAHLEAAETLQAIFEDSRLKTYFTPETVVAYHGAAMRIRDRRQSTPSWPHRENCDAGESFRDARERWLANLQQSESLLTAVWKKVQERRRYRQLAYYVSSCCSCDRSVEAVVTALELSEDLDIVKQQFLNKQVGSSNNVS